jgi:hypothetical protein
VGWPGRSSSGHALRDCANGMDATGLMLHRFANPKVPSILSAFRVSDSQKGVELFHSGDKTAMHAICHRD